MLAEIHSGERQFDFKLNFNYVQYQETLLGGGGWLLLHQVKILFFFCSVSDQEANLAFSQTADILHSKKQTVYNTD